MFFAFIVSFFFFVHINVGAELYISELLFAAYLVYSIKRFKLFFEPFPRKVIMLGVLWLLSQITTDIIRNTPIEDLLRGWMAIVSFLIDFCAAYVMVRTRPYNLHIFMLAGALGAIFSVLVLSSEYSELEPWKFGYGIPVTMLFLLYMTKGNRYKSKMNFLLLGLLGMLSVYLNARSLGGMTILTAIILYFGEKFTFKRKVDSTKKRNSIQSIWIAASLILAVVSIFSVYQWAAESGYLPEKVTEKYQMAKTDNIGGIIGIILGGRSEILISSQAVIDSPIIGHGSWASDAKYTSMLVFANEILGQNIDERTMKYRIEYTDRIPTHSVIMQAWVWAGLMGAVFWLFILKYTLRCTLASIAISYPLKPLVIFVGISSVWNLLFSPFGGDERIRWVMALMVLFVGGLSTSFQAGGNVDTRVG